MDRVATHPQGKVSKGKSARRVKNPKGKVPKE